PAHREDTEANGCARGPGVHVGPRTADAGGVEVERVAGLVVNEQVAVEERLPVVDGGERAPGGGVERGADPGVVGHGAVGAAGGGGGLGGAVAGHGRGRGPARGYARGRRAGTPPRPAGREGPPIGPSAQRMKPVVKGGEQAAPRGGPPGKDGRLPARTLPSTTPTLCHDPPAAARPRGAPGRTQPVRHRPAAVQHGGPVPAGPGCGPD